jgi:hypothetical protein
MQAAVRGGLEMQQYEQCGSMASIRNPRSMRLMVDGSIIIGIDISGLKDFVFKTSLPPHLLS